MVDTATNKIVSLIQVDGPGGIVFDATGKLGYVTTTGSYIPTTGIAAIDTTQNVLVKTITLTGAIARTPDGKRLYVADSGISSMVEVVDTASAGVIATIPVTGQFGGPTGVAITPDGARAYVTSLGSSSVSMIDTASGVLIGGVTLAGVVERCCSCWSALELR